MAAKVFFEKLGHTYSLNPVGKDSVRFNVNAPSAQGFSQVLTLKEAEEMLRGVAQALFEPAEKPDSSRRDKIEDVLTEYAALQGESIEMIDKEISRSGLKTREAWLADKLDADDFEEVLAGKMTLQEALEDDEEELEAAGVDTSSPDKGSSLRA